MVASGIVRRLAADVEALEAKLGPSGPALVAITVPQFLDEGEVLARHYELHPEDRDARKTIVIFSWGYRPGPSKSEPTARGHRAAWQIDREEAARMPPAELARVRGLREIRRALTVDHGGRRFAAMECGAIVTEYGLSDPEVIEMMAAADLDDPEAMEAYQFTKKRTAERAAA